MLVCVSGTHGCANVLCVAVWFFCWNTNVTVSPTWAVMFDGLKKTLFGPPTTTRWSEEIAVGLAEPDGAGDANVTLGEAVDEGADGGGTDSVVAAAGGGEEAEDVCAGAAELAVPPVAAAWNAANLSPGLMAKTMPF